MPPFKTSVLIPSFGRPHKLKKCLESLARQTVPPTEVLVVWQQQDEATASLAQSLACSLPYMLRILHSQTAGIVPAENLALDSAVGEIVLMIDDDAIAPAGWVERHLSHYHKHSIGAVGGSANNFHPDGTPFAIRSIAPQGYLTWYGKFKGNMFDHPGSWSNRPPQDVAHLVGYNMSLRRSAFGNFASQLKPYWQMFEADACLQVLANGYRVLFDYQNSVEHWPENQVYAGRREGDLTIKIVNGAYNYAFVLGRHTPSHLRPFRFAYLILIGSIATPGLLAMLFAIRKHGGVFREAKLLLQSWLAVFKGWKSGSLSRTVKTSGKGPRPKHSLKVVSTQS